LNWRAVARFMKSCVVELPSTVFLSVGVAYFSKVAVVPISSRPALMYFAAAW
jgi:hypothetical protein